MAGRRPAPTPHQSPKPQFASPNPIQLSHIPRKVGQSSIPWNVFAWSSRLGRNFLREHFDFLQNVEMLFLGWGNRNIPAAEEDFQSLRPAR